MNLCAIHSFLVNTLSNTQWACFSLEHGLITPATGKNAVYDDWLSIVLNGAGVSSVSSPVSNTSKHNLREYITIRLN